MRNGPALPDVKGLSIQWFNQSEWPTDKPLFYGNCDDDADLTLAGIVSVLSEQEYTELWDDEKSTIDSQKRKTIKDRRDKAIIAGTMINGITVATDDLSQQRITGAALAATVDNTTTVKWKLPDASFVTLDATQTIGIAHGVRAHVQACFDRESELLDALAAGTTYDIEAGWPT